MDKLTTRALQAQVEAAVSFIPFDIVIPFIYMLQNVDRENSNKVKQEEGALAVARIKAQSRNVSINLFSKLFITNIFNRRKPIPRHIVLLPLPKPKLSVQRSRLLQKRKLSVLPLRPTRKLSVSGRRLMPRSPTNSHAGWRCVEWKSRVSKRLATRLFSCLQTGLGCRWATQWQWAWLPGWPMAMRLNCNVTSRASIFFLSHRICQLLSLNTKYTYRRFGTSGAY